MYEYKIQKSYLSTSRKSEFFLPEANYVFLAKELHDEAKYDFLPEERSDEGKNDIHIWPRSAVTKLTEGQTKLT